MQSKTLIINEDIPEAIKIWDKIYDLLITSARSYTSYQEVKSEFESAKIKNKKLQDWEKMMWESEFQRSHYFFELANVKIFFKTNPCPNEHNKLRRCQPNNLERLKNESNLYKKLKHYAS